MLRLAEERGAEISGVVLVNPFVATKRKESSCCRCSSTSSRRSAAIVNDIKKPGQDEHGYHRLPLKGPAEVTAMWKVVVPELCTGHPAGALLPLDRGPRDRRVLVTHHPERRRRRPTSRSEPLDNSYHVATLDNDAERIFAESADFIAGASPPNLGPVSMRDDDAAWQQIVDNYGERPDVAEPRPSFCRRGRPRTRPVFHLELYDERSCHRRCPPPPVISPERRGGLGRPGGVLRCC